MKIIRELVLIWQRTYFKYMALMAERNNQSGSRRLNLDRVGSKVLVMKTVDPGCEIGMEACTGAHHWARQLHARKGYDREADCATVREALCEEQQE